MSKKKNIVFSEEELGEFYNSFPEVSKHYLSKNMKHILARTFPCYSKL